MENTLALSKMSQLASFYPKKWSSSRSWEDAVMGAVRGHVPMLTQSKRSFQPFVLATNWPIRRSFRRRVRCSRQKRSNLCPSLSNFDHNPRTCLRARPITSGKSKSWLSQKSRLAQILQGLNSSFWRGSKGENDERIQRRVPRLGIVYFHRVCEACPILSDEVSYFVYMLSHAFSRRFEPIVAH